MELKHYLLLVVLFLATNANDEPGSISTPQLLDELRFLFHVNCEEKDLNDGRSCPNFNGSLKFEFVTRKSDSKDSENGGASYILVAGGGFVICIGVVLVVCCCKKNSGKTTPHARRQRGPIDPESIDLQDVASSNERSKVTYVFDDHCDDETSAAMYAAVPDHVKEDMRTRPPPPFSIRAETSETMNNGSLRRLEVPSGSWDRCDSFDTTSEDIYEVVRGKDRV